MRIKVITSSLPYSQLFEDDLQMDLLYKILAMTKEEHVNNVLMV